MRFYHEGKRSHWESASFLESQQDALTSYTPEEFPFAILYFTGSKTFNTIMRARALELGYSMNEHGFTIMKKTRKPIE